MIKKLQIISVVIIFLFVLSLPFFIKVVIECKSQFGECPEEVKNGLANIKHNNLFEARQKSSALLKKNLLVSSYSIQFKLPNIMQINIIAKKPHFALKTQSGKFGLIDRKGLIISLADSSNLPVVSSPEQDIKVGDMVNTKDLIALNLVSGVYQMYQVGYGSIENNALVVDMPIGVRVIFPLDGNIDSDILLGGLRLIYSKVATDYNGVYSQIDMRYKNPVLR